MGADKLGGWFKRVIYRHRPTFFVLINRFGARAVLVPDYPTIMQRSFGLPLSNKRVLVNTRSEATEEAPVSE